MTSQQRKLVFAAAVAVIVVGLVFAGVPVSVLLLIGAVAAMVFMHAGGHGNHGGCGMASGHQHSSSNDQPHSHDETTRQ